MAHFNALNRTTHMVFSKVNHMRLTEAAIPERNVGKPTCPGVPWGDLQFCGPFFAVRGRKAPKIIC
jgi:hypothetical protein